MAQVDPKIASKAEDALRKLGAFLTPLVLKDFLFVHGDKIASGDTGAFWEAIDEFRTAHPERFSSGVPNLPNLMERNADGKLRYSGKEAEAIVTAHSKALNYGKVQAALPQPVNLSERDDKGELKYSARQADAAIERVIAAMRRGAS